MRSQCLVALLTLFFCGLTAQAREPWVEWKDCRLEENDSNDGDSFHITAGGKSYIFRLYFVDAPETDTGFPERVAEQGQYFGITPAQSVQLGELAKKFVEEKLAGPFTVRTSKQNAMGRSNKPRYYAFLNTGEGDLGELLVANGMARVHGVVATPLGLDSPAAEKLKLKRIEREARAQKVGGWGALSGRMATRLLQPAKSGGDSFDQFFHPKKMVAASPMGAAPAAAPIASSAPPMPAAPASAKTAATDADGGRLDLNNATAAELMKIKGVGPVLAGRIIEARPFQSANDLRRVKGIGAKKYAQIRPYFAPAL
ncbi:MAG TPA: helix-hairpin-helix domain-containing protein [Chthoniobacterales bacterium]|nr:helix-hairpin-helix domain-containing protein [Chthoniobacterales bacterium]